MKICSVVFALLLFAGCKYDLSPPDAGSVERHLNGNISKGELSQFQIEVLSEWIRTHREGWKFKVEDRAPELLVSLRRRGSTVAVLDIHAREVAVKNLVRSITPEEYAKLFMILADFLPPDVESVEPTATAMDPGAHIPHRSTTDLIGRSKDREALIEGFKAPTEK